MNDPSTDPTTSPEACVAAAATGGGASRRQSLAMGLGLGAIILLHGALVISTWGPTYWDFGDGNYLYISRRMTEGVTLYRDILAPQPPMHLVTGAALVRLGDAWLGPEHWYLAFRGFSLALRSVTAALLCLMGWHFFRSRLAGWLAATIWLFLPIGFWWQLGYQSEPLEILFLLLAVLGVWRMTPGSLLGAGLASALAVHTNMTAAPYVVCNAVFLLCRHPRGLPFYLAPFAALYFSIAGYANAATDGHFWNNVIFNQTGTFPPPPMLWGYLWEKLPRMIYIVVGHEGVWLALAAVGIAQFTRMHSRRKMDAPEAPVARAGRLRAEYLAWSAIGHFLSIGFTAKGGTVDYIFTIGEPFVALFGAWGAVWAWSRLRPHMEIGRLRLGDTLPFLRLFAGGFLLVLAFYAPVFYIGRSLVRELPEEEVARVVYVIEHYTNPGDAILAPPFYAMISHRRVAGEYSENYIWTMKYYNERRDGIADGPGVEKIRELQGMLERREIPLVLLDMAQTGRILEIQQALAGHYQRIEPRDYETRNTRLSFWIPRDRPVRHIPLTAADPHK